MVELFLSRNDFSWRVLFGREDLVSCVVKRSQFFLVLDKVNLQLSFVLIWRTFVAID